MDYRKLYEEHTSIKIPDNYHVHHIDGDRDNNKLINLVALPSKLHQSYHSYCRLIPDEITVNKEVSNSCTGIMMPAIQQSIDDIEKLDNCRNLIMNFVALRDHFLGFIKQPTFYSVDSYQKAEKILGYNNE